MMIDKNRSVVTVIFEMWGQRCTTVFEGETELDPEAWIERCYERGFMVPIGIVRADATYYDTEKLREMTAKQ